MLAHAGMSNPNEPNARTDETNLPGEEVLPLSERRADKGMRRTGFWAIVIGVLALGLVAIVLEITRPADANVHTNPAGQGAPASGPAR